MSTKRDGLRMKSVGSRSNRVDEGMLAGEWARDTPLAEFIDNLPDVLAVRRIRRLAVALLRSRDRGATSLLMYGGHVIKCGLGPLLVRWMRRGLISGMATNGAGTIHDLELDLFEGTSESVQEGIADGSFGMWRETGDAYSKAVSASQKNCTGLGEALGKMVLSRAKEGHRGPLAEAAELGRPVTVHPALGGDIVHPHPSLDWGAMARAAERDFDLLISRCSNLSGGVVLNAGSAVVLPEVFLKALTSAQNLGADVREITTANMDMIQHYRPSRNVLSRPVEALGGEAISLTGHHELMLPLLDAFIAREES